MISVAEMKQMRAQAQEELRRVRNPEERERLQTEITELSKAIGNNNPGGYKF